MNCFLSTLDLDQALVRSLQPVEKEVKPKRTQSFRRNGKPCKGHVRNNKYFRMEWTE
jgi:hypothetical protein